MFKSIFIRYITAFIIIIALAFVILASLISALITTYSIDMKDKSMSYIATVAGNYIKRVYGNSHSDDFADFVSFYGSDVAEDLYDFSNLAENSFIFLTDHDGNIIISSHPIYSEAYETPFTREHIDEKTMLSVREDKISHYNQLGGLFTEPHLIYPTMINHNEDFIGALFVCSSSAVIDSFVSSTLRTIIMSSLWVMLAAIVIVYFITERIVAPLAQMSRAAKSFATGKFDVRVNVTGNDEVSELAMAFNNMATELAANDEMHRTFIANVSHDLRTPMTSIAGYIEGILDGTIPPEKHSHYLKIVTDEVRRLSRLVASLLDITRIQAGEREFNMTNFDVCETARRILISFEQRIDSKKLEVEFESDRDNMYALADADAIHQIMYNLIENAIKFSYEGGILRISITEKEKKLHVCVFNTGEGISKDDLPFVFDRFYKTDRSRGLDKTGVGLGLFIVKTIVDAHEEQLWVTSDQSKNCAFTFTLRPVHETMVKKPEREIN